MDRSADFYGTFVSAFVFERHDGFLLWNIYPGATAKFPLVLATKEVKSIHQNIDFVVNGNHFRSFTAEANVVAVSLDLSTSECLFRFDADNWGPFVDQVQPQN